MANKRIENSRDTQDSSKSSVVTVEAKSAEKGQNARRTTIVDSLLVTVVGTAIIGLIGTYIGYQKNDIVSEIRKELEGTKIDLLEKIEEERNSRIKLAVALKDAGINIRLNDLLGSVLRLDDEEVDGLARSLPLAGPEDMTRILKKLEKSGLEDFFYAELSDGSSLVIIETENSKPYRPAPVSRATDFPGRTNRQATARDLIERASRSADLYRVRHINRYFDAAKIPR